MHRPGENSKARQGIQGFQDVMADWITPAAQYNGRENLMSRAKKE